jgi:hypothetical protein
MFCSYAKTDLTRELAYRRQKPDLVFDQHAPGADPARLLDFDGHTVLNYKNKPP